MSTDVEKERARLSMSLERALEDEWGKGIAELRAGDASLGFVGDALVHLHDQLLGAINYRRQVGRDDETTSRILDQVGVEPKLRDLLHALRAAYMLREKRRKRLIEEAGNPPNTEQMN